MIHRTAFFGLSLAAIGAMTQELAAHEPEYIPTSPVECDMPEAKRLVLRHLVDSRGDANYELTEIRSLTRDFPGNRQCATRVVSGGSAWEVWFYLGLVDGSLAVEVFRDETEQERQTRDDETRRRISEHARKRNPSMYRDEVVDQPEAIPAAEKVSPSYDCRKASSHVEREICNSELLSKLDSALGNNYRGMMASNIGDGAKNDLRSTQRQWIAERDQCKDESCLVALYRDRVDAVCDYPVISGVHPGCTQSNEID